MRDQHTPFAIFSLDRIRYLNNQSDKDIGRLKIQAHELLVRRVAPELEIIMRVSQERTPFKPAQECVGTRDPGRSHRDPNTLPKPWLARD